MVNLTRYLFDYLQGCFVLSEIDINIIENYVKKKVININN